MKKIIFLLSVILLSTLLTACLDNSSNQSGAQKQLLVYCSNSMVKPIAEIAQIFEKETNVKVAINPGPSDKLYQDIKSTKQGDLYLPDSADYREKYLAEGLLGDEILIGHNQAAFLVQEGNPKKVSAQISELLRDDLKIGMSNPSTSRIGNETKDILSKRDLYWQIHDRIAYLAPESASLNSALKQGDVDLVLNWRASGFFEGNRGKTDVITLPIDVAQPKKLLLNYLTVSKKSELAHQFMEYVASVQGQAIFRSYGYLDIAMKSH